MIDGIPVADISPWALVAMFVILVATGRLIPRRTYDDKVHEADEWRAESRIKDAQLAEKDKQLAHMGEVGRTVRAVMRALQQGNKDQGEPS